MFKPYWLNFNIGIKNIQMLILYSKIANVYIEIRKNLWWYQTINCKERFIFIHHHRNQIKQKLFLSIWLCTPRFKSGFEIIFSN